MLNTKAVNILLSLLLAVGLFSSLLYSLNLELNSDMVVPGLVAMELVNHGNFNFTFPVGDPYFFTDVFTFHFLPQVLSNYDPTVLRLTAYVMFLMVIGLFSYLVYKYSGLTGALIFAALATNLPHEAYQYFLSPEYHVGTLIFTGLFLILFQPAIIKKASTGLLIALSALVALIVISDSIIIAFFILPYLAYCLYCYRFKKPEPATAGNSKDQSASRAGRKLEASKINTVLIALILSTVVAYELKMNNFFVNQRLFFITPIKMSSFSDLGTNLSMYIKSLFQLLSGSIENILSNSMTIPDLAIAAIFLSVLIYSFVETNRKATYLYAMFLLSAVIMLTAYLFTGFADGLWSSRFLIYTAISLFAVIALAYKPDMIGLNRHTLFLAAILVIILASAFSSVARMPDYDYQPNKGDYALISYLEKTNLQYGFTDYDHANKLIYLSKERVLYPKVQLIDNQFAVFVMLTNTRWYDLNNGHGNLCLLTSNTGTFYQDAQKYASVYPPNSTYQYDGYTIYQYTNIF